MYKHTALTFALLLTFFGCSKKEEAPKAAPKTGVELVAIGPILFGGVLVTESRDAAVRVYNYGPDAVDTSTLSTKLTAPFVVQSVSAPCNSGSLPANSNCIISVRFAPTAAGEFSQTLTIGNGSILTTGRGLLGGVINLSENLWEVGPKIAGEEAHKTITVSNLGDFTVPAPVPQLVTGVTRGLSTCGSFIPARRTCTIELVVKKTMAGQLSESIIFNAGDAGAPVFTLITHVRPSEPAGAISFNTPPPFIVADGVAEYTVSTIPVRDQYGNIVTDGTNVRLSAANASLLTASPQQTINGIVTFTFRAPTVKGDAIISLLSGEATGILRTPATAGPPSGTIEVQTYPTSIVANGQSNVEFRLLAVKDQFGNVVENNTPIYFFINGTGSLSTPINYTFFGQTSVVLTSSTAAGDSVLQVRGGPILDANNQIVGWRASGDFPITYLPGVAAGTIPLTASAGSIYADPDPAIEQQGFAIRSTITIGPVRDANGNLVAPNTSLALSVTGGINGTYQNQANPVTVTTNAAGTSTFFIEGNGNRGPITINVTSGAGAVGNLVVYAIKDTRLTPDNTTNSKIKIFDNYSPVLPDLVTGIWAPYGKEDYIPLKSNDRIFADSKKYNVSGNRRWMSNISYLSYPCWFSGATRVHLGPCLEDNVRDKPHLTYNAGEDTAAFTSSEGGVLFDRGFQAATKPNGSLWEAQFPSPRFPGIGYNPKNDYYVVTGGLYYDNFAPGEYAGYTADWSTYFFPMTLYGSSKSPISQNSTREFEEIGVHPPATAMMAFASKNQWLFGFGGYNAIPGGSVYNQVYVFNTAQGKWSSLSPDNDDNETGTNGEPAARYQNGIVYEPTTNSLYIFGGNRQYYCNEFLTKNQCNQYRACTWDDHEALGMNQSTVLNSSNLIQSENVFGEDFCEAAGDDTCSGISASRYGAAAQTECGRRVGCIWNTNTTAEGPPGCYLRPGTPDGTGKEYTDAKDIWQLKLDALDAGNEQGLKWKKVCDSQEPYLGRNPNFPNPAYRSCNLPAGPPGVPTVYPDIENNQNLPRQVSAVWNDIRKKVYIYWNGRSEVKSFDPLTQIASDAADGAQSLAGAFQVMYNKFSGRMFGYQRGTVNGLNSFIDVWETNADEKYYQRVEFDLGAGARNFTYAIRPIVRGAGHILFTPWSSTANYVVGDKVSVLDPFSQQVLNYIATANNTNQSPPTNSGSWTVANGATEKGLEMRLYNFTTNTWDLVGSNDNDSQDLLVLQSTEISPLIQGPTLPDYISASGKVEMLISNKGAISPGGSHEIHLDSVALDGRF